MLPPSAGFPPGATVGYAKSQIRDVLKTEFNKSIELQVHYDGAPWEFFLGILNLTSIINEMDRNNSELK